MKNIPVWERHVENCYCKSFYANITFHRATFMFKCSRVFTSDNLKLRIHKPANTPRRNWLPHIKSANKNNDENTGIFYNY